MRIILVNQFFWPDAAATSQLLTDVARHLAAQGHDVEVLCGESSYSGAESADDRPPVTISRIPCWSFTRGKGRLLSYATFFLGVLFKGLTVPRADVVMTLTTPPMLLVAGTVLQKLKHGRHFIWEMDLFPEALVDLGMLESRSWVVRLLGRISDFSRRRAERVIVLGDCMRRRLLARGISGDRIVVAENWADGRQIFPLPSAPAGPLTILYSGNLGLTHECETLMFAMDRLKHNSRFRFRFVGGGPQRASLEAFCQQRGIENVSFEAYCSREDLASSLAAGDVGLVTQRTSCVGTVVPSKVYGLMAAGRPILYIGPKESTAGQTVRRFQCGWQVDCGDGQGLVSLLQQLEADRDFVHAAGARAREAFLEHYDLHLGVARITRIIDSASFAAAGSASGAAE
jgi:colanic acid biosynthesis glycosyl transferase WcaI